MPIPESSTSTRTALPAAYARRTTRPCGVCFAAFSPRFRSACSSKSRLTLAASPGVHRIRHELALGQLAPLLLGEVVEHDQHRVAFRLCGDPDEAERALLVRAHVRLRERRVPFEEMPDELAQREAFPWFRQLVAGGEAYAEQP